MSENSNDLERTVSPSSHNSNDSAASPSCKPEENATYFLLDVKNQNNDDAKSVSSHSSKSSTDSSSSSVSAQVVIDHGSSIPRHLEKNGMGHLTRSGDDESESDYAFCYTPVRRESDAESSSGPPARRLTAQLLSGHTKLHSSLRHSSSYCSIEDAIDSHTDFSGAENDGDVEDDFDEGAGKVGTRKRRHRHRRGNGRGSRKDILNQENNKAMVTVYTEEDDDLVDEMPRGDRERMMRHNRKHGDSSGYRRRSVPRRLHKRTQKVLQSNLQSQSWSRRESLQSSRHPGLSSEEALGLVFGLFSI
jgi:hypothetical protein